MSLFRTDVDKELREWVLIPGVLLSLLAFVAIFFMAIDLGTHLFFRFDLWLDKVLGVVK